MTLAKGKFQANLTQEYRHKSPKQNISKPNPAICMKDYSRNVICLIFRNQCDSPH